MATVLGSLIDVSQWVRDVGYPLLFVIVMTESSGVPVPGEIALITASLLAAAGKLQIEIVIPVAAGAAITGDNIGYLISRRGGRWLLERPGRFQRQRLEVLRTGEPFFERHGPKVVFFGRFILGLRVWASWLAGATRMPWRSFVFWNACGGIAWATAVGLIAYFVGHSAENAIETFGLFGLIAGLVGITSGLLLHRRHRGRTADAGAATAAQETAPASHEPGDTPGAS